MTSRITSNGEFLLYLLLLATLSSCQVRGGGPAGGNQRHYYNHAAATAAHPDRTLIQNLPDKPENFPRLPPVASLDPVTLGVASLVVGAFTTHLLYNSHPDWVVYPKKDKTRKRSISLKDYLWSFDPYSIDWEKFSILDWIAIGQEIYEKFDPADADCQLRLICEVHQNTSKFGTAAQRMVDFFSYLQFTEVLSLPDEVKVLVEEWLNAADRGRNGQKECGEVYQTCGFSVNKIVDKYTHNEI